MKLAGDKIALCIERPGIFLYKSAQAGNTTALCIERCDVTLSAVGWRRGRG
jgi:hypothetical protein